MTEDEAKTKWCPFANSRVVMAPDGFESIHQASDADGTVMVSCIGSDCMAWRWNEFIIYEDTPVDGRDGFCGLAGK